MGYDPAISIPTLIGSFLSCLATSCVLISYTVFSQPQQLPLRHVLVLNLALAEFINSLNNSVSGIYVIAHRHEVAAGTSCELNGFIGQLSVQAADFSILAIALITLFTVIKKSYLPSTSSFRKIVVCGLVWFVPLITSSTAAGLRVLQPVSGNWCWITKDRTDLRYALGHGWRFSIIIATILIYGYIYFYIQHHFSSNRALRLSVFGGYVSTAPPSRDLGKLEEVSKRLSQNIETARQSMTLTRIVSHPEPDSIAPSTSNTATTSTTLNPTNLTPNHKKPSQTLTIDTNITLSSPPPPELFESPTSIRTHMQQQSSHRHAQVEREVCRMLLLNAYPVAYVILWLPGIADRIVEAATGSAPRWLMILQSSTQFIGLANALTYGFNEHMRRRNGREQNEGYGWSWRRGVV
ncbi:G protein-coupled glucose receptor regulating Gpa2-domain-containing protein [Macrophomina phaseolina]|uniref:G protein-coupled glucose receptor regulating Gpa2-domain-containing protein n=1 Tax=Macrophomina phaseolina TaxID=35725 RepID=A0ABQ8GKH6_9PEZI|nr:G protein-coupled glucose receptor regulating Gpa2-domain-containing protein [Macrophomina phaseolina]